MDFPLRILRKHLDNERKWLTVTVHDRMTQEGQRMARERVPQLEQAIELLSEQRETVSKPVAPKINLEQLNLFK